MSLNQFKKNIVKDNWYDKYYYYLIFLAVLVAGLLFLFHAIMYPDKYEKHGSLFLVYLAAIFFISLGISGAFFIPNRYKVIIVDRTSNVEQKIIIEEVIKQFNSKWDEENEFYNFNYQKSWRVNKYKIYLSFDSTAFYLTVLSNAYKGGIIDFGGTEKIRSALKNALIETINKKIFELPAK